MNYFSKLVKLAKLATNDTSTITVAGSEVLLVSVDTSSMSRATATKYLDSIKTEYKALFPNTKIIITGSGVTTTKIVV